MAIQFDVATRNAALDARETAMGASTIIKFRSGAKPTNIVDADAGTVLATLNLPADFMGNAANGVKALLGTWQDLSADASGTIGHYRRYKSDGTTVVEQGTVTATGGGGDIQVDNTVIASGQQITITAYSWTEGNA
jgi:hypothetical protein